MSSSAKADECRFGAVKGEKPYLAAEKRLSNELACTIGCEPVTRPSFAGAAGAAAAVAVPVDTLGFSGGRAAACFVSGFDAGCGSVRWASITFGFAGTGCVVAVVSAAAPPRPTLRARLLKKPSDCAFGAADATRVEGVGAMEATSGSSGEVNGPCGGLTVGGMVPGARSTTSDRP